LRRAGAADDPAGPEQPRELAGDATDRPGRAGDEDDVVHVEVGDRDEAGPGSEQRGEVGGRRRELGGAAGTVLAARPGGNAGPDAAWPESKADFCDQAYYPCLEATIGRPYALYVHGGSDTTGAVRSVETIATGLKWKRLREPVTMLGAPDANDRETCWRRGSPSPLA